MTNELDAKLQEAAGAAIDAGVDAKTWFRMAKAAMVTEALGRTRGNQYRAAINIDLHRNTIARILGSRRPRPEVA